MALFCGNFACSAHTRVNITPKVPSSHFGTLAILYSDSRILAILTSCRMIWRHGKLILEGNGRFYLNSSNKLNQQSAHQEGPSQQGYPQPSFRFHSNILSTRQQVVTLCVFVHFVQQDATWYLFCFVCRPNAQKHSWMPLWCVSILTRGGKIWSVTGLLFWSRFLLLGQEQNKQTNKQTRHLNSQPTLLLPPTHQPK